MWIMDYKALFDDVMCRKYDTAPLSDDDEFIAKIKERASNMEKKKIRSRKPAVIAASIAAAAVLTGSVGALVNYYHQRSVDSFIYDASGTGSAVMIDEASTLTSANEHFRVTLDKTYFDGENMTCILTVESLDGTEIPNLGVYGSHDGDFRDGSVYNLNCWASTEYKWNDTDYATKRAYEAHITGANLRLQYTPYIGDEGLEGGTYLKFRDWNYEPPSLYVLSDDGTYVPAVPESEWNIFHDIVLRTDVEKNVETAELYSEMGAKLILSEIGYYSNEVNAFPIFENGITDPADENVALVLNDGTTRTFDKFLTDAFSVGTSCYVLFPETIELDEYMGIEVNGIRYLKK